MTGSAWAYDQLTPRAHAARRTRRGPRPLTELARNPGIAVVAPSIAEVVRFAGGWLVDQVLAGWPVTAFTADRADVRPLIILGAAPARLESALGSAEGLGASLRTVVVSARLYESDEQVRRTVSGVRRADGADVRLCGDLEPERVPLGTPPVRHRLSPVAQAFKGHALAAALLPGAATDVEVFRDLGAS